MARRSGRRKPSKERVGAGTEAIDGQDIRFEIWEEDRRDTRFSLTTRMAYLRVPRRMSKAAKLEQVDKFRAWLRSAAAKRPDLLAARRPVDFVHGGTYALGDVAFRLSIAEEPRKSATACIVGGSSPGAPIPLSLKLPTGTAPLDRSTMIERLLYRLAAKQALPRIERLLDEANDAHFQVAVGRIKLSPTTSRWGSCSSTGNINLSSRLLGAPERCLRAVIVHELAHRIEMNHSERFWKLVYGAMPDYAEADAWLKREGGKLGWRVA